MLFLGGDELDLFRNYFAADAVVVDEREGEVQEVVAVRGHVERALQALFAALRHAAYLDLIRLVHQALELQQTLAEGTALDPLEVLLVLALDVPLELGWLGLSGLGK